MHRPAVAAPARAPCTTNRTDSPGAAAADGQDRRQPEDGEQRNDHGKGVPRLERPVDGRVAGPMTNDSPVSALPTRRRGDAESGERQPDCDRYRTASCLATSTSRAKPCTPAPHARPSAARRAGPASRTAAYRPPGRAGPCRSARRRRGTGRRREHRREQHPPRQVLAIRHFEREDDTRHRCLEDSRHATAAPQTSSTLLSTGAKDRPNRRCRHVPMAAPM